MRIKFAFYRKKNTRKHVSAKKNHQKQKNKPLKHNDLQIVKIKFAKNFFVSTKYSTFASKLKKHLSLI